MLEGYELFKGDPDDLVKDRVYYFKESWSNVNGPKGLIGRKYKGYSPITTGWIFMSDSDRRVTESFILTAGKNGAINTFDSSNKDFAHGPIYVKHHVKEQRGGKTRRVSSEMQLCESEYCGKTFLDFTEKMSMKMAKTLKMSKKAANSMLQTLRSKEKRAALKKECMKGYCNPDCKDNLFQNGKSVPSAVYKSFKGPPKMKAMLKSFIDATRKVMFRKKTSILKNSFYNKLPVKNVTRAKKQGALSGCSLKILT